MFTTMINDVIDSPDSAIDPFDLARDAASQILSASGLERIDVALVLGSGWGEAAGSLGEQIAELAATEVPGFTVSGVPGHKGTLRVVRFEAADGQTRHALVLGARTHYYENRGVRAVAHGMRVAAAVGAKTVVLTNGCGGLNPAWTPGTTVLISDHLNFTGDSPIEGANFVDLTDLYSSRLRDVARSVNPDLEEGIYAQFRGPHYETPAEVRMAGILGATLVGMSTALEAIAARQVGLEILGLSLVTNLAAGVSEQALSHEEVLEAGQDAAGRIGPMLARIVREIG